jgi:perosamine synthetase
MRSMSLHGLSRNAWNRYAAGGSWRYDIVDAGFKYNLTDMAAALGLAQLRRCQAFLDARSQIAARYHEAFRDLPEIRTPAVAPDREHAWHLYVIQLQLERMRLSRDEFIERLAEQQIGASVHFIPLHLHSYYRNQGWSASAFPHATAAFERIVSLPIFPGMTGGEIQRVIDAVRTIVTASRR